jgi:hypothetical protein
MMASQSTQLPTNERIVRLLEELKSQLADADRRQQQMARDLSRLLERQ